MCVMHVFLSWQLSGPVARQSIIYLSGPLKTSCHPHSVLCGPVTPELGSSTDEHPELQAGCHQLLPADRRTDETEVTTQIWHRLMPCHDSNSESVLEHDLFKIFSCLNYFLESLASA